LQLGSVITPAGLVRADIRLRAIVECQTARRRESLSGAFALFGLVWINPGVLHPTVRARRFARVGEADDMEGPEAHHDLLAGSFVAVDPTLRAGLTNLQIKIAAISMEPGLLSCFAFSTVNFPITLAINDIPFDLSLERDR
jgi:hypothetical protein